MNARLLDPDRAVRLLVELAQRSLTEEAPRRDAASFVPMPFGKATSFRPGWVLVGGGITAAAASAALVAGGWATPSDPPLTVQVVDGEVAPSGAVEGGKRETRLRFSDGSEISLGEGARARVAELRPRGSDVRLERGALDVRVVHRPRTEWSVHAGPYTVEVTGTAFDVSWSESERAFSLELREGSVVVVGPQAKDGVRMTAGQRLSARAGQSLVLTSLANAKPASVEPASPVADPSSTPEAGERGAEAERPSAREAGAWGRELARGNFASVVADAEQRGLDAVCGSAGLEDLGALADAARYARRFDVARRALLASRERFPSSGRAREAAFFLGRIAEEQGDLGAAVDWYERYLAGNRRGAYLAQALGRKMVIVHRQRGPEAARALALEYQSRFPKGDYAATAKKIAEPEAAP